MARRRRRRNPITHLLASTLPASNPRPPTGQPEGFRQLGAIVLAAAQVPQSWSLLAPDAYQLRQAVATGQVDTAALRATYLPATGLSLAVGAALGYAARSWLPVAVAGVTSVGLVTLYEHALPPEVRLANPLEALAVSASLAAAGHLLSPTSPPGTSDRTTITDAEFVPQGGF